ncbi:hypothetical protein [Streptomonospora arabica]|uniref:SnoaL-like domain-containing protein n=1 Tax=Streptomonospora arabica TaxID=412417 RepID=A0ABV9SSH1_9ACTN
MSAHPVHQVEAELARLAVIGNKPAWQYEGTLAIARELARHGATGRRRSRGNCALANHLKRVAGTGDIEVTRYEVLVGPEGDEQIISLVEPPGDLCILRYFVCDFDDQPQRFRRLRATA